MSVPVLNRYKLVGGPHRAIDITADPVVDADGNPVLNKDKSPKFPVRNFQFGDIVVSADDLTKKHVNKFIYAGPYGGRVATSVAPVLAPSPVQTAVVNPPLPKRDRAELEAMTVADLRALAGEEEINLGAAHNKAEIITAILAAQ